MATSQNDTSLPAWAYVLLACVAAAIGLASSGITAQFFVLGLQKIEEDAMARDLLIATGALMIVTELAAFGVAALLPERRGCRSGQGSGGGRYPQCDDAREHLCSGS